MIAWAKNAGESDAMDAFGLRNHASTPPPTWAQRWLDEKSKNGTKKVTIPSMTQENLKK